MIAGGIALVEPMVNAVAFFIHEKVWNRALTPAAGLMRSDERFHSGLILPKCGHANIGPG